MKNIVEDLKFDFWLLCVCALIHLIGFLPILAIIYPFIPEGVTNLNYFELAYDILSRKYIFAFWFILGCLVLLFCAKFTHYTLELYVKRRYSHFFQEYPNEGNLIKTMINENFGVLIQINAGIHLFGACFYVHFALDYQWLIFSLILILSAVISYVVFIIKCKEFNNLVFVYLRKILSPYLIGTICLSVLAYVLVLGIWHKGFQLGFFLESDLSFSKGKEETINFLLERSAYHHLKINLLIEATIYAVAFSLLVIWTIPMLIKRSYMNIIFLLFSIGGTVLLSSFIDFTDKSNYFQVLLTHTPPPIISIALLISIKYIYNRLLNLLKIKINCSNCRKKISNLNRYCDFCGTKNVEI